MAVAADVPPLHRRRLGKRLTPYLLLAPALLWLVVFFVVPIVQMFFISLQEGNVDEGFVLTWNWATYPEVLSTYDTQLVRSIVYGLIVTLACLGIGYPLAYAIALRGGRWKSALLFMVVLPFFVSYLIRTISWKFILADDGFVLGTLKDLGVLGEAYRVLATPTAVIFGLIYNFLPFMVLPLYVSLEKIDPSMIEAAEDLYAHRWAAFRRVTLPLSLPGVFAGSLLTFIPSMGDFINASLLGNPNTTMIGNVIQREFLAKNDYPEAAAISFVLMAAIVIGVAVYAKLLGTEELTG